MGYQNPVHPTSGRSPENARRQLHQIAERAERFAQRTQDPEGHPYGEIPTGIARGKTSRFAEEAAYRFQAPPELRQKISDEIKARQEMRALFAH